MARKQVKMLVFQSVLCATLCVASTTATVQLKPNNQVFMENHQRTSMSNKQMHMNYHKPEPSAYLKSTEQSMRNKQLANSLQPLLSDGTFRVTLNDAPIRYAKLENILSLVDRVAYSISKPVAVINVLKYVFMALSSFLMSAFIGTLDMATKRQYRSRDTGDRSAWFNPLGQLSPSDFEGMIELMTRNYDEMLNRAGLEDRASCRERSLCVLGDMMACDFPNLVVTVGRFAQQHLPPIDTHKNKYTKALILGLNQTDCDRAYQANVYDCPSVRDYIRSYFQNKVRQRRDYHYHWRQ